MTKEDAAALLNGFEYPAREIETHAKALKEASLVPVFGQSDDLMEFRGAIYDETDAYNGARGVLDRQVTQRAKLYAELDVARWLLHGTQQRSTEIVDDAVAMLAAITDEADVNVTGPLNLGSLAG